MKKKLLIIINIMFLVMFAFGVNVFAKETITSANITVNSIKNEYNVGETAEFVIHLNSLEASKGIITFGASMEYNHDILKLLEIEGAKGWSDNDNSSDIIGIYKSSNSANTEDIATIRFEVLKPSATTTLSIKLNRVDVSNGGGYKINSISSNEITVRVPEEETPPEQGEPTPEVTPTPEQGEPTPEVKPTPGQSEPTPEVKPTPEQGKPTPEVKPTPGEDEDNPGTPGQGDDNPGSSGQEGNTPGTSGQGGDESNPGQSGNNQSSTENGGSQGNSQGNGNSNNNYSTESGNSSNTSSSNNKEQENVNNSKIPQLGSNNPLGITILVSMVIAVILFIKMKLIDKKIKKSESSIYNDDEK